MKHSIDTRLLVLLLLLLCLVSNGEAACSACPGISLNNDPVIENGIARIRGIQKVLFTCLADRNGMDVVLMNLTCSWANGSVWNRDTYVSMEYYVGPKMHLKTCECESKSQTGVKEKSEVTIHLKTRPELIDPDDYDEHFHVLAGESFEADVGIWANPELYSLRFKETFRKNFDYINLSIRVLQDEPIHNVVTMKIKKLKLDMAGGHNLEMSNGFQEPLDYLFYMNVTKPIVKPKPKIDETFGFYQLLVGLSILLALLILGLVGVLCSRGVLKRKEFREEEVKYSLSYAESPKKEEEENINIDKEDDMAEEIPLEQEGELGPNPEASDTMI